MTLRRFSSARLLVFVQPLRHRHLPMFDTETLDFSILEPVTVTEVKKLIAAIPVKS